MRAFDVNVFSESAGIGMAGTLRLGPGSADIALADGRDVRLSYAALHVDLGGSNGTTWILSGEAGPGERLWVYAAHADFGEVAAATLPPVLREHVGRLARKRRWRAQWPAILGGGLVAGGLVLTAGTLAAFNLAVEAVPPAWEIEFGKALGKGMRGPADCPDPTTAEVVGRMGERLAHFLPRTQPYEFEVHVVCDGRENAFALPGGQVMVTTGLLAEARTPDEVGCILGHEFQHVLGRHTFRRMARELGLTLVVALVTGDTTGSAGMLLGAGKDLLGLKFDRDQEREADAIGLALANDAGFEPRAMAGFFARQLAKPDRASVPAAGALLSTHPADSERIARVNDLAASLPARPRHPFLTRERWNDLRAQATKLSKSVEETDKNGEPTVPD